MPGGEVRQAVALFFASKRSPFAILSPTMKPRLLLQFIPCLLLAGEAVAEDTSAKLIQNPRILYSSTVRRADGGTTTYQRIEPPTVEQLAALHAARMAAATPASPVSPLPPVLNLTARVYDGTLTEIQWQHEGIACRVWSSVDFRLLEAIPQFEHGGVSRRLAAITVTHRQPPAGIVSQRPWPQFPAEVLSAVPQGLRAWYVLIEFGGTAEQESAACAALDALHAYVEVNWEALQARRTQREAQKTADAAYKAAHPEPPPAPTNTIIQFWKEERP